MNTVEHTGPLFAYSLAPIDFWEGWLTEGQYKIALVTQSDQAARALARYESFRDRALDLGRDLGWEGDFREGPFVSGLPSNDNDAPVVIAWKQDNNGSTFVVSPLELPWLGRCDRQA